MINILCYGDGNTFGYEPHSGERYTEDVRWPGRLQAYLGNEFNIIEDGCVGRTTAFDDPDVPGMNGLKTLDTSIAKYSSMDMIIIMLGTNDLKEFASSEVENIVDGVEKIVKEFKKMFRDKQGKEPQILVLSPPEIGSSIRVSPFYGQFRERAIAKSRRFPKYFREMAVKNNCLFFDTAEWVKPSEYDSVHLIAADHVLISDKVYDIIIENKDKIAKKPYVNKEADGSDEQSEQG